MLHISPYVLEYLCCLVVLLVFLFFLGAINQICFFVVGLTMKVTFLVFACCCGVALSAVAKKDRKIDTTLSDKEFGSPDYDHEAFLGKEQAQEFDELSPEESRRRLAIIAQKIDSDGNGKVSESELEDWIIFTQQR